MSKKTYFTKVSNEILEREDLSQSQKMTYIAIFKHANWNTYRCNVGMATLAKEASCSKRTIQRCIIVLIEKGLLKKKNNKNNKLKEWNCNTYTVNPNPSVLFKTTEEKTSDNITIGMDKVADKLELSKDIDSDMIETNIKKIEKVQIKEKQLSSKEIISKLKETFENKIVNKALSQFKKVAKSKIVNNLYAYLKAICENIKVQFELYEIAKDVKVEEQKEQSTYKKSNSNNSQSNFTYNNNQYKNRFHNFEQRTDKYTAEEIENMVRDNFELEDVQDIEVVEEVETNEIEEEDYLSDDVLNYINDNIYTKINFSTKCDLMINQPKYVKLCKAIKKLINKRNLAMNY